MRRRRFITVLGGAGIAWPLVPRAERKAMPVIGVLSTASPDTVGPIWAALYQGLREAGYVERQNVAIEYRWAEGRYDRLPALAADLVMRQVTVIVAGGGEPAALAAKAATSTIPIVFTVDGDPVKTGLVTSLSRPGGNITGQVSFAGALGAKRLGLVLDLVPTSLISVLVNPNFPAGLNELADLKAASEVRGQQLLVLRATNESEIEATFTNIAEQRPGAVIVCADVFFVARREMIVSLAARFAMPAIYVQREYPLVGGLISYGI